MNAVVEDTKQMGKEAWVLFQDTEKAYDTISLNMLERAFRRIKLLTKVMELIIGIFRDRRMRVIMPCGPTDMFFSGNGINQEEIISPLV